MMRISTINHGYFDYMLGSLLISIPLILKFPDGEATYVFIILGAWTILLSLMTVYEFGIAKLVSITFHLKIDILAGVLLATSPWLFGFAEEIKWPFVIFGIAESGAAIFTSKEPTDSGL